MPNQFIPKFVRDLFKSAPIQEVFWHRVTHQNEAALQENELLFEPSLFQELLEGKSPLLECSPEIGEQIDQEDDDNAARRYQIAFEHASQYGEIESFEYNDQEGSSKVVYRSDF